MMLISSMPSCEVLLTLLFYCAQSVHTGRSRGNTGWTRLPYPDYANEAKDDYYDYDDHGPQSPDVDRTFAGWPGWSSASSASSDVGKSPSVHSIPCYSCHYVVEHAHKQGPPNCQDPFVPDSIPTVTCDGACAKMYRKLDNDQDFFLSRNCMPNCKEFRSPKGYTECCTQGLCNGSRANIQQRTVAILTACLLIAVLNILLI